MEYNRSQKRAPSSHVIRSRSTTPPSTRTSLVGRSKSSGTTTPNNLSNKHLMSQRSPSSNVNSSKSISNKAAVSSVSKSAWALSPGRSFAPPPPDHSIRKKAVETTTKTKSTVRGGVSGVLKYFKSKKNPKSEEEFHNFKMLHNRLVQWRFTNAKAGTAMTSVKVQAQNKLFSISQRILKARNMIMEKRILMQRHQLEIKLLGILNPQMNLLDEWMRIEKRNFEALSRMNRKLCAISVQLPLIHGAESIDRDKQYVKIMKEVKIEMQGDIQAVYDSIKAAMDICETFEECIPRLLYQVEELYSLVEMLSITVEQQRECAEELSHWIATVSTLEESERSARLCLIQNIEQTLYL